MIGQQALEAGVFILEGCELFVAINAHATVLASPVVQRFRRDSNVSGDLIIAVAFSRQRVGSFEQADDLFRGFGGFVVPQGGLLPGQGYPFKGFRWTLVARGLKSGVPLNVETISSSGLRGGTSQGFIRAWATVRRPRRRPRFGNISQITR